MSFFKNGGNETVTNCYQLKMKAPDGKMRSTDVADTEQLFQGSGLLASSRGCEGVGGR